MRIVDVLKLHEDDDIELSDSKRSAMAETSSISSSSNGASSADSSSRRSLISRWLRPLRKPGIAGGGGEGSPRWSLWSKRKKEGFECGGVVGSPASVPPSPVAAAEGEGSAVPRSSGSGMLSVLQGRKLDHVSFNLGLGTGLALILARSASEFNKMIEMQRKMEIMLKEIKDAVQSKDSIHGLSNSSNRIAFSASDCYDDSNTSKTFSLQRTSLDREERKFTLKYEEHSNCDTNFVKRRCPEMDELEAQLEIELERLQLNLKGDTPVASGFFGTKMAAEDNDSSGSFSIKLDEHNDHNVENQQDSCGVSAHELERRLHELLETRQEEQIAELESALECTKSKLHDKEIEVSQWREMATRALHQLEGRILR